MSGTAHPEQEELARVLGGPAASALSRWAEANGRAVRLTRPVWRAGGYTGAKLAAINVRQPGGADVKLVLKVCPAGVYAREPAAHRRAQAASAAAFITDHLVDQPFDPYPVGDGGHLMFQDVAGATFGLTPLTQVPDVHFDKTCGIIVQSVLRDWAPHVVRSVEMTTAGFLDRELHGALEGGGSIHDWATALGLFEQDTSWFLEGSDRTNPLPNPVLMAAGRIGGAITFDVSTGASHGDLHLENVLVPVERDQPQAENFRLVDLSTFEADAPLSRDPVTLMLSVIAQTVDELRMEEQDALLDFVLHPWTAGSPRLTGYLRTTLNTIHEAGYESLKIMRQGDWRSQFLLSVLAGAMLFACYENLTPRGRWWYFRLAAHAGRRFLQFHNHYLPASTRPLHRPTSWPTVTAPEVLAGTPHDGDRLSRSDHEAALSLLSDVDVAVLAMAYDDVTGAAPGTGRPDHATVMAKVGELIGDGTSHDQMPRSMVLVDRCAHLVGGVASHRLHEWLDQCAERRLQVSQSVLRARLCQISERFAAGSMSELTGSSSQEMRPSPPGDTSRLVLPRSLPRDNPEPGDTVNARTTAGPLQDAPNDSRANQRRLILGPALPSKNPNFTGRETLLQRLTATLLARQHAAVVPQTLHGLGGVGKTQLAVEYVYRHAGEYDLIWWIPAEDPAQVRQTLAELATRLDLPAGDEVKQTISLLFEALAAPESDRRWLLVYDNVTDRANLAGIVPPAGSGHVIITSRNTAEFATDSGSIEVDIFERQESIELLQRHGQNISPEDADRLAEKLGDLPLALEQAAIWNAQTKMPVPEYLELFDRNIEQLLSEGRPVAYPETVFAIVKLAVQQLRREAPGAAELLEAFAFFGAEPVAVSVLRSGRLADLSDDLSAALRNQIDLNRAIRRVNAYGLVKITDSEGQRLQVHRLVQRVLREELVEDRLRQARRNVQNILSSANPGEPDDIQTRRAHKEIGPHILAAELISAVSPDARTVVLDQIRYLFTIGDYEASRRLGMLAYEAWTDPQDPLGSDHEITLIAGRHLANAFRLLGESQAARDLDEHVFRILTEDTERFGEHHEHTLYTANNVSNDLRILGDYAAARKHDERNVELHTITFGPDDDSTLRARSNLAVNLRFLGLFAQAEQIDRDLFDKRRDRFGENHVSTQESLTNLTRDLIGLGKYSAALELQRRGLPIYRDLLSARHAAVLMAARAITIALRRTGSYADARDSARENYHDHRARFGEDHEHSLSAALTFANALRVCNELQTARSMARDTVERYRRLFGSSHALTLAASINLAIILRRLRDDNAEARRLAESNLALARQVFGDDHPYSFAAATGLANSFAEAGESAAARDLAVATYERAERFFGPGHPETLLTAVNAAIDLQATGDPTGSDLLLKARVQLREVLHPEHPIVTEIGGGERAELDIEPPPS
ncbi:FxSxx-COOH system tetratricopeptide repeat protein [Actinoplanes sp. NPDC051470]|uniref:FxSxx-COOH system tetratricopeptide repeat protein n=1 Tax=Actinoplanes sp. NPDC051470 TaxID=3157224 RepID=UPI00344A504D